MFKVNNVK